MRIITGASCGVDFSLLGWKNWLAEGGRCWTELGKFAMGGTGRLDFDKQVKIVWADGSLPGLELRLKKGKWGKLLVLVVCGFYY